jgi:archaellum component FlaC
MKIFGKEFKTRKELKADINRLETNVLVLRTEYEIVKHELNAMKEVFPFAIGQTVYDVQLRNEQGRYAKKNVSLEHSRINEVVVDEKNYFGLVERHKRNDVFVNYDVAREFLESICVSK